MEAQIKDTIHKYLETLYNKSFPSEVISVQYTKKEIAGDYTINVFPVLKFIKQNPEKLANDLASVIKEKLDSVEDCTVIKGFINIRMKSGHWINVLHASRTSANNQKKDGQTYLIEFSSPNTNKPLHLGHIRNNLLGDSISRILTAAGNKVIKVNLVNDRGIHICKSMLAYNKWGNNQTPESTGIKGDKLTGNFYVLFETENKKLVSADGNDQNTPLMAEAREMLKDWEKGEKPTVDLWRTMNNWVYAGFDQTYNKLGISFDKTYFESETYKEGKAIIQEGLKKGVFYSNPEGAVCVNLEEFNLDEKVLLRSDGTSVYITQDIGTARQRFQEFNPDKHIYVVGNEQIYHFQVLKAVLKKLAFEWSDKIFHLSYGMVELPEGKMKSREGKVVDADDLIEEMVKTAEQATLSLGKLDGYTDVEKKKNYEIIALSALKYFILKVDPKKNMMFNPEESIDFNGNTGPFVQYSYTRIRSIIKKAEEQKINFESDNSNKLIINQSEIELIKLIHLYTETIDEASLKLSPSHIANYAYALAREFNQYYHEFPVLKESDEDLRSFRLLLISKIAETLKNSMNLLGIEMPEKM